MYAFKGHLKGNNKDIVLFYYTWSLKKLYF